MALRKSSASMLKVSSTARRSRGLTSSVGLTPPAPRLYDLEYQQLTEDFRDGLIGYNAYSEYLTGKLEGLQPDTLDYFSIKKKLDNITFQQIDKQMDYGFRVAKSISPDDYISWKEQQLEDTDPDSDQYMQLQSDIKSAKTEKISRERSALEFDILMETKNKEDLAKFYLDTANGTDDPEAQMKYYGLYSKTVDSMNAEILKQERDARALEEKEMRLKFNRGDLGKTFEENIEAYYNFVEGQYSSEFDPSRQMTYMSQLDSLVKQYDDYQEGIITEREQAGKASVAAYSKSLKDKFYSDRKEANSQMAILKKELNMGNLTSEEYAQQMMELFLGEDGYLNSLNGIALDPNISEDIYEKLETEFSAIQEKFETDGFWKANMPVPDDNGNWSGKFFTNPNYKAVQDFDKSGNVRTSWEFDPSQSYEMKDAVWDAEAKVWRKVKTVETKNEKGEKITTKEIYRLGESGEVIKETYDEETKQWKTLGEEGFVSLDRKYRDANTSIMGEFARQEYIQKKGKEVEEQVWSDLAAEQGMFKATLARQISTKPEGAIAKLGELGGDVQTVAKGIVDKARSDFSAKSFREIPSDLAKIDVATAGFLERKTEELGKLAEEGKARFIGEKGEAVKEFQDRLVSAGTLAKKFATGFFGPETQKATQAITERVQADFSAQKLKQLPSDIGIVGRAIGTAAKKYFAPQQIGGALGEVYSKRSDLQKVFDPSGAGKGAWAGKTIQDWARIYGIKEEPTLKALSFEAPKPKFQIPKLELPSWIKKPTFEPVTERVKTDFSLSKLKQLPQDIKTVTGAAKTATSSFLKKLKFWGK